jgi:PST family polysaccharide transporter
MSKWVVVATNLAFTISALAKIYFFLTKGDLIDLAWVGLFEIGLTAAFLMIAYRLDAGKFSEWRVSGAEIYRLLVDGFPLLFAGLAVAMYMRIDVVMLQHMKGAGEVGVYAAAVKVSEVLYFLPGIMVSSIAPALINAYKTDLASYTFNVRRLYFVSTWISIVVAIPVCAMSDLIVRLLFSSTFSDAAGVLSIHTWASVAVYLGVASSQCLVIEGLQKISFYRTLMGCALNIVLNIALIPTWGATGAALATVVSYFFATYSMLFYKAARHHFHLLIRSPFMFKELLHND